MDKCLKLLFLTAAIELHSVNLVITEKISFKAINLYIFFPFGYLILSYQLISKDDNLS